jgi:hypothetical protein
MFSLIYGLLAFLPSRCVVSVVIYDRWWLRGREEGAVKLGSHFGCQENLSISHVCWSIVRALFAILLVLIQLWGEKGEERKKHSRWYFNNVSHRAAFHGSAVRVTTVFQFRKTISLIRLNANVVTIFAREKYSKRFIFALLCFPQSSAGCRLTFSKPTFDKEVYCLITPIQGYWQNNNVRKRETLLTENIKVKPLSGRARRELKRVRSWWSQEMVIWIGIFQVKDLENRFC